MRFEGGGQAKQIHKIQAGQREDRATGMVESERYLGKRLKKEKYEVTVPYFGVSVAPRGNFTRPCTSLLVAACCVQFHFPKVKLGMFFTTPSSNTRAAILIVLLLLFVFASIAPSVFFFFVRVLVTYHVCLPPCLPPSPSIGHEPS